MLAARLYPEARFFGIDVSTEMLTSAISAISRRGMTQRIRVAHGDGNRVRSQALFGLAHLRSRDDLLQPLDDPGLARRAAGGASRLAPGGRLHVVDFGNQERLPGIARALLLRWLAMFDVTPRDDLDRAGGDGRRAASADLKFERPFRGYAQYAVLTLPREPTAP